uniref:Uncharacterized protein n=1 Tax=Larimichthys crocea TaxID=215358 RepID=A0A0F8BFW2_LARCR
MSRRTPPSSSPMPVQRQQPGQVIPGEGSSTSDPQGCQNLACKRQKKEASAQIKRLRKLQAQHQPSSSSEDQEEPQQQPQPQKKQPWPSEGPDGQPGYQHVLKLATALVEVRSLQGLSDTRVDGLILLWNHLPEQDKQRVVYPPRQGETGEAAQGKNTSCPGKESLQRWPSASRLVEAIYSQLWRLHLAATLFGGTTRTRWSLILSDYVAIREAVLASPRLMAQTDIQLFELNQRTLSQWFCWRQKETWRSVLEQGTGLISAPAVSVHPLPPAKGLSCVQVGQPFYFQIPEKQQPGPSNRGLPPPPPGHTVDHPGTSALPPPPPLPVVQQIPRTTAYRKRKAAQAVGAGLTCPPTKARRQSGQYTCSRCGRLKRIETGHTRIAAFKPSDKELVTAVVDIKECDERVRRYHFRHCRLVSDHVNCSPHPGPSGHLRQGSDDLAIPMLDAPAIQEIWCTQSPESFHLFQFIPETQSANQLEVRGSDGNPAL